MKQEQLRDTIERLGLTQAEAAHLIGVKARTMRHWINGDRNISEPARKLFTLLRRNKLTLYDVEHA